MENKIYNQIIDLVEGKANLEESQSLLELIEKDDAVAQLYCEIVEIYQEDKSVSWDSDKAFENWQEKLNQGSGGGRIVSMKQRNNYWLKIAAVLLPLIIIASIWLTNDSGASSEQIEVMTSLNEKKEVTLPDGSIITLNEQSQLTYQSDFEVRTVNFQGEGFFEIAKNPDKPFTVENTQTKVTVLGTKFNVSTSEDNSAIEVAVVEGKVRVEEIEDPENFVELTSNELGVHQLADNKLIKVKTNAKNKIAWNTMVLSYDEIPLDIVIADLEKVYKVDFELVNQKVGECTYKVDFENYDLSKVLEVLEFALDGSITKIDNQYIINAKPCN